MAIQIDDLNNSFDKFSVSSSFTNQAIENIRELSNEELFISGGETVTTVSSDSDSDGFAVSIPFGSLFVYGVDEFSIISPLRVNVQEVDFEESRESINFEPIDFGFDFQFDFDFDSDSDSASSSGS